MSRAAKGRRSSRKGRTGSLPELGSSLRAAFRSGRSGAPRKRRPSGRRSPSVCRNRRPVWRRRIVLSAWLLAGGAIVSRAVQVQIVQGADWQSYADQQQQRTTEMPAPRGAIVDRNGVILAMSQERVKVNVAPREVLDPEATSALLSEVLGITAAAAERAVTADKPWVVLRGDHPASVRGRLRGVRGVHLERRTRRFYPTGSMGSSLLGVVMEGDGAGGIEQAFDSLLGGRPGREIEARDASGRAIPWESWVVEEPQSGAEIVLTIDRDLQEIALEALRDAVDSTGARGGDLLITRPKTGEVLAMVSLGDNATGGLSAINAPYEPGSTAKPFVVAGLLDLGLVLLGDSVDTAPGHWTTKGRTVNDVSVKGMLTIGESLRYSSNVGVAKAAQAYQPLEQWGVLRDFGFGVPTGLPLPGEQSGLLRHPDRWSAQSSVSLAIGYELSVTPIQMAMAYGALANGGRLMEPRIVREVKDPAGRLLRRYPSREVRQVVSPRVAEEIADVLVSVVEGGTGTAARLSDFTIAGKSGTSRAHGPNGYAPGDYFASFAGFFPAEDPQLVLYVRLDRPRGGRYYGGSTAAPVTRAALEAILAASRGPIDRGALAEARRRAASAPVPATAQYASLDVRSASWGDLPLPAPAPPIDRKSSEVRLPDLSGLPARVAARRLHAWGVRVDWDGGAQVSGTQPQPGTVVSPGDTVVLRTRGAP